MGRVRWVGVALGTAATFSLVLVLGVYLGLLFPRPCLRGRSGLEWYRFVVLGTLRPLLSLFVIFFLGSVVTGAAISAFPGLNDIVSSAATQRRAAATKGGASGPTPSSGRPGRRSPRPSGTRHVRGRARRG